MKFNKGANIVEYVIPLAIVGLVVGLGIFYLFQSGNLSKHIIATGDMDYDKTSMSATLDKNLNPGALPLININGGDLNGTPNAPVKECKDSFCVIDFGTYALSGVPENFNTFVETSGAAGGTEKMSDLLIQIAQSLQGQETSKNTVKDIMVLATIGHNIASVQRSFEKMLDDCNWDDACINNVKNNFDNTIMQKPEGYDERFFKFPPNTSLLDITHSIAIGNIKYDLNNNSSILQSNLNKGHIGTTYINTYEKLMSSNELDDQTKGIIQELYWDIGVVSEDISNVMLRTFAKGNMGVITTDPITGIKGPSDLPVRPQDFYTSYNASKITNFDSALICASGNFQNTGNSCH